MKRLAAVLVFFIPFLAALPSCGNFANRDSDLPDYVKYTISGNIKNELGDTITGVNVSVISPDPHILAAIKSDSSGYRLEQYMVEYFTGDVEVKADSITVVKKITSTRYDTTKYAPKTVLVTFSPGDFKGGDGYWYLGKATKEKVDIILEVDTTPAPDPGGGEGGS